MKVNAISSNGHRHFTCKRCGTRTHEPLRTWKKKPQRKKTSATSAVRSSGE